jgi:nicotinate-nucleotide--dimethylbenzimidazole phosphoribosyltransferase
MTLNEAIASIKPLDEGIKNKVWERWDSLTKPPRSLGRLEEIVVQLAGIMRTDKPEIDDRYIVVMAGDHGIARSGVSAYPQEVTVQMVYNFLSGGAGINAIASTARAKVMVVDVGVAKRIDISHPYFRDYNILRGTEDFSKGPAMSRESAVKSIEVGIRVIEELNEIGFDIVGTGEMGIGNTTPSSAILKVFSPDTPLELLVGPGTGLDEDRIRRKADIIAKAIELNKPDPSDPVDVLSKVGGLEIGAIAGLVIGCASLGKPVIIDGFISTVGALLAYKISPDVLPYIIPSHLSREPGHRIALELMGLKPLLTLDMRLGEGTGSAIGMLIIDCALSAYYNMKTFEEAGVSRNV